MTTGGPFITAEGVAKAAYDLEALGLRAQRTTRDASYKVQTIFRKGEQRRFSSDGPGWPQLEQSTRERKQRENVDRGILRATEALFRSLTSTQAASQVDERTSDEMAFGTALPYARFHQHGKGVPQRVLIDLSPSDREQIDQAVCDFISKGSTW